MKIITHIILSVFVLGALPTLALAGGGVVTYQATNITQTSATISGYVDGGANLQSWMEINTSDSLSVGTQYGRRSGGGPVSATVTNLTCNYRYYYRAVAEDAIGVVEGNVLVFDTLPCGNGGGNGGGTTNPVSIISFNASPSQVSSGSSSTLSWTTSYATSCSISGLGSVATSGSQSTGAIYGSQSYTLTCYGANNSQDSRTVYVSTIYVQPPVVNNVSINSFVASPSSITSGNSSTLSWSTQYASSCSISGLGTVATGGSRVVTPTYTQSYTLTCYGSNGSQDSRTTSVSVQSIPVDNSVSIINFTPSPSVVSSGNSSTLSWSTQYASSCSISGLGTVATGGSRVVTPTYTQTYTLTCTGTNGSTDSRTTTVTVSQVDTQPVRIDYLNASPNVVTNGGYSTLSWGTTNAISCSLTDVGTVSINGSRSVGPIFSTRSYTLTCTGNNGSTDSRAVSVSSDQGGNNNPLITSFTATPSQVTNGGYSTLYWSSTNASYCTVDGSTVSTSGNRSVGPIYGTRSFTLLCYGTNGGSDSRTVYVYSDGNNGGGSYPTISYFSASPLTVTLGGYTTLSWSSNADYCTASGDWSGTKSISGTESVGPIYGTKTYILTCYRSGNQVSQTVTVYGQNNGGNTTVDGAITNFATRVGQSSAQLNGIALSSMNRSVDAWFEWGSTYALGNVTTVRTVGSQPTNDFSAVITGLSSNRTYYYRAVARTNNGTFRGDILHFTTGTITPIFINPTPTPTPTGTTTLTYGRPVFMDVQVEKLASDVTVGTEAEFRISYRSLTDRVLQNVLVKVALPEEFQYVSATRGTYAQDSRTLTLPLGDLQPRISDSFIVRVRVLADAQVGKTVAVTGYGNYTVPAENNLQAYEDEVVSYVLVTIQDIRNLNGAAVGLFGLFPGSILGWLLLIVILLLIVYLLRRLYLSFTEYKQAK